MQGKLSIQRLWLVLLLCLGAVHVQGQGELYIFGVVKDYADGKKLEGVKITAYENGTQVDVYTTSSNGKYEFFLDLGKEYVVEFERPGWVSKKVYMDSRNIPEEDIGAGFSMNIEMSLFEEIEGLDITILEQPIGKAKYNPNTGALEFDFVYTQKIKDELNRLMREWEKGSKDKKDKEEEEQKELEALEKEFNKLVEDADGQYLKEEYQAAVANYKEALKLKPDNPMVKNKLKAAEEKLVEQKAAELEAEKYEAALKAGDDFMRTEEYSKAIAKYEEALAIRKDEKYPKDQIAEANKQLEEQKKREEELKHFNELVSKGDNLVKAMDFDGGIAKYQEALAIKEDTSVEDKIKAAEAAKADYEAQKAKEAEFENFIAQADAHFKAEEYESAIGKYEEALGVKPDESYPKERIAEAQKRLDELAKQKEEELRQQELEQQFNELVAAGDARFEENAYSDAITTYQEALGLKPENELVKNKIAAAQKKIDEREQQAALEANYNAAIEKGDEAFGNDELEVALGHFQEASGLKPAESYPTERIKAINDLIAERERIAEEKRLEEERKKAEEQKRAEELAQFNNLVASGDEFFQKKEYQKATEHYEEALKLKPENQHLPNKIKEAQKLQEELRAKQDIEQNYRQALEEGERKFKGQNYEGAIEAFERASNLKPDEAEPVDRIEAAHAAIAEREEAEKAAALAEKQKQEEALLKQKEAEQAKLRDEFNRIVASGDDFMEEKEYKNAVIRYNEALELIPDDEGAKEKLLEADRLLNAMLQNREVDKQYNMILADADAAYQAEDLEGALAKYYEAKEVKPGEAYPQERITEIEETLAERRRKSEAARESELEAQRKKEQEALERQRLSEQEAELAAIDEEYNTYIEVADRKMGQSEYDVALRNYEQALALKPGEYYPKARIQEIELLLEEEAERKAEEERLAALERERDRSDNKRKRSGASVDSQTEDEAERFMREARLREEAEKYERIKRLKEERSNQIQKERESETERSENYLDQVEQFKQNSNELYADATAANEEKSERMKNYKKAVAATHSEEIAKERDDIDRAQESVKDQEERIQKMREAGTEVHEKSISGIDQKFVDQYNYVQEQIEKEQSQNEKAYTEVKEMRSGIEQRDEKFDERQESLTSTVMQRKQAQQDYVSEQRQQEEEQVDKAQERIQAKKAQQEAQSAVMGKIVEENTSEIEERKNREAERQKQYAELAEMRAKKAREDAHDVHANEPKDYDDYYLSQLAQDYPQGVTEESDNVGNKVIIRRIVVIGNKADEYRKVIDKTGKYYFKNGDSISERTWNSETNPDYD